MKKFLKVLLNLLFIIVPFMFALHVILSSLLSDNNDSLWSRAIFFGALFLILIIISYLEEEVKCSQAMYRVVLGDTDDGQILFFGKSDLINLTELTIEEGISTITLTTQFSASNFKVILESIKVFDPNKIKRILSGQCIGDIINPNYEIIEKVRMFKKVFEEEG